MIYREIKITLTKEFYDTYWRNRLTALTYTCVSGMCAGAALLIGAYINALPRFTSQQMVVFCVMWLSIAFMCFSAGIGAGVSLVGGDINKRINVELEKEKVETEPKPES
jgi:hypothetical protein